MPFGKPGQLLRSEILDVEQRANLPPRALGSNEHARLGQRLQAGGKVWRLPDNAAFLRRTRTDQIADHDEPGGNADPYLQRLRRL